MILIDNRDFLRVHHRPLLNKLTQLEVEFDESSPLIEPSKKGAPTLKLTFNGKMQYLHSKYDPESEASRLIDSRKDV